MSETREPRVPQAGEVWRDRRDGMEHTVYQRKLDRVIVTHGPGLAWIGRARWEQSFEYVRGPHGSE